jgi:hypothetical protein
MFDPLARARKQSRDWRRDVTIGIACQCLYKGEFAIALGHIVVAVPTNSVGMAS